MDDADRLLRTAVMGAILAAATSVVLVGVLRRRAAALQLVDVPNERSTHVVPTPKGGGIGILAGLLLALLAARLAAPGSVSGDAATLVALACVVGLIGLVDDRAGVPAKLRLAFHLAAATALVLVVGPMSRVPLPTPLSLPLALPSISVPVTVLWIAGVTNFFNFMDGVDGLAGGQAVVSSVGIAIAGWSEGATVVSLALAGASVGFLLHNWPPARIFMGDVGSGAVGFLLAGLPLLAPPERRSDAVLAVGVGLTFFILDPVLTLVRRAVARRPLMQAHREHLYQRLIPAGTFGSHVTTLLLGGAGVLTLAGALSFRRGGPAWTAVGCAACLFLVECVWAFRASTRKWRSDGAGPAGDAGPRETGRG